jgi:hypothetical protein
VTGLPKRIRSRGGGARGRGEPEEDKSAVELRGQGHEGNCNRKCFGMSGHATVVACEHSVAHGLFRRGPRGVYSDLNFKF